jgi:hypothetical protein
MMKNSEPQKRKETNTHIYSTPLSKKWHIVMLLLAYLGFASNVLAVGDRHPHSSITIPPNAFINGEYAGNVYDVTNPPDDIDISALQTDLGIVDLQGDEHIADPRDNAKDDTLALILAMNYVIDKIVDENNCSQNGTDCTIIANDPGGSAADYVIYLPNGTYNVNDTIVYSHALRVLRYESSVGQHIVETIADGQQPQFTEEVFAKMRFVGQSREGVTIKLRNQSAGFNDVTNPKPVISFGKGNFNNLVAHNAFKNITIDTNHGNQGAIGLNFSGANSAVVQNVTVRSGGYGAIGIKQSIEATSGFMTDVTVEGFNTGIWIENFIAQQLVLEHATFTGQSEEAVRIYDSVGTFRKILSNNRVPFMKIASEDAHIVLLDSDIKGGSANHDAIEVVDDEVSSLVRNVRFSDYGMAIDYPDNAKDHSTGYIDEYVSSAVAVTGERDTHAKTTLRLPIEDAPVLPGDYSIYDTSDWVCPEDMFTANDELTIEEAIKDPSYDWTNKIQQAVNSGKPVLYFPRQEYRVLGSIRIPSNLHRIEGFYASFTRGDETDDDVLQRSNVLFLVNTESTTPLVIENLSVDRRLIHQTSSRTIVLQQASGDANTYMNVGTDNRPKLFAYSVVKLGKDEDALRNMDIWGRMINTEQKTADVFTVSEGARMWVLGFKTEGSVTTFNANGATIEVLGGIVNNWGRGSVNATNNALLVSNEGHVSFSAATTRASTSLEDYNDIVSDRVDSVTTTLNRDSRDNTNDESDDTTLFFPHRLWDANSNHKNFRIPLYAGYDQTTISALNRSILTNGDFESGLSAWQVYNGGAIGLTSDSVWSGNQAALVSITNPNQGVEMDITADIASGGAGIYEAIAWVRGNQGPNLVELVLEWVGSDSGLHMLQISRRQAINSIWKKLTSAPVVIDWEGDLIYAKFIVRAVTNNRNFYVDNCVFERQPSNLEIIKDGGFEEGIGDWEAIGEGSLSIVDSQSFEGNQSLQSPNGPIETTGISLDVTKSLLSHGKGVYDVSVNMKAAPNDDKSLVRLEIAINDARSGETVIPIQKRQADTEQWRALSGMAQIDWVGELQSAEIRIIKESNGRNFIVDEATLVRR